MVDPINGLVTGIIPGTVTITATANEVNWISGVVQVAVLEGSGSYDFVTIEYPGGSQSGALKINNNGQILGSYNDITTGITRGFLYSGGVYESIEFPGATDTFVEDINIYGQIAGWYSTYPNSYDYGSFLYSAGTFTSIAPPDSIGSNYVHGINDAGEIVGWYWAMSSPYFQGHLNRGFIYSGGSYTNIDFPYSSATLAIDINNNGQIIGKKDFIFSNGTGFVYSGGSYTSIDFPGSWPSTTAPEGLNINGQTVGTYEDSTRRTHGFMYSDGGYIAIDYPGNVTNTYAFGINDAGEIVGSYNGAGFLATPK